MREEFKIGDKVILLNKSSKHFGKEGTIIDTYQSIASKDRWKIKLDDPSVTLLFIASDDIIEHTLQYKRDNKLNDLGI